MKEDKFSFGINFQLDLLKLSLDSLSFLLICKKYVQTDWFSNERVRFIAEKIYHFHDKYGTCADKTYLKAKCRERKDRVLVKRLFRNRQIREQYIRDSVEEFVKRSIFVDVFEKSGKLFNLEKTKESFAEMMQGVDKISHVSLREDEYEYLFRDFDKRLLEREQLINSHKLFRVPTGIFTLDKLTGGGPGVGELCYWMGDAKSGKSFALTHIGVSAVKRYFPVLHIQLEGTKRQCSDRYDACFSGSFYDDVKNSNMPKEFIEKMKKVASKRKYRDLIIKHYNDYDSCDILDIERDLINLRNSGIDIKLVIIDYFDLLRSRKGYRFEEERFRQMQNARDLKVFAMKNEVVVWTATQTNRSIDDEDPDFILTSKNVAEDYNKIRILDLLCTINRTSAEAKKNVCRIFFDMYRDNVSKRLFRIRQDLDRSRFYIKKSKI
jgi:replicative DNA helicase